MKTLDVLLLADEKPGHYHLSEGVVAALQRLGPVQLSRLDVKRRRMAPGRLLRRMAANVAATRLCGGQNIFLGSLRRFAPENFDLVITSFDRFKYLPRHIVALKPSSIDPNMLRRPNRVSKFSRENPPALAGLLIGGGRGQFKYSAAEWRQLLAFIAKVHKEWGTRWLVSTSRRTGKEATKAAEALVKNSTAVQDFIDYRAAGPGTLPGIFKAVDLAVVTEDSSTMISEAIATQLPVIGVTPHLHDHAPHEAEYRQFMVDKNWIRSLPIARLGLEEFETALSEITPMTENHIDVLARRLKKHLLGLFE